MPRDPSKSLRSPTFKAKLQQIKGLSADEKALVTRVGNLLDFLQFSRQESNPTGAGRKKSSEVPVPTGVSATGIAGGFILTWEPVEYSLLSAYEVQFDTDSVFSAPSAFEVIDTRFVLKEDFASSVFLRVRTLSKEQGLVSAWSSTTSISVRGADIALDFDHIYPENRTTVLPKPTLVGATTEVNSGDSISVGVGAVFAGSPLTLTDDHSGFPGRAEKRNEITYDLMERDSPYPSLEQRISGPPDFFIERSSFYVLAEPSTNSRFYIKTFIYPSSFVDFFATQPLETDPSEVDVEFLRYRIAQSFYFPDHSQTGIVLEAVMSAIKV